MLSPEERDTLRALPYADYLLTPWWRARRNLALRRAGWRCERCGGKRHPQVHHRTDARRGAEWDEDLEVRCRGCDAEASGQAPPAAVYRRVVSDVIAEAREHADVSDFVEACKVRCAQYGLPVRREFNAALADLLPRVPFAPPPASVRMAAVPCAPLTRAEAAGVLARLRAADLLHHMPPVHLTTGRALERRRAWRIVAQAIVDQVAACERHAGDGVAPSEERTALHDSFVPHV